MTFILALVVVFGLLVLSEVWWRSSKVHDELSRKFVHITVGSFVAFWPFFMSWNQIRLLSLAFLIGVALSKYLNIFQAIHSVQRPTWGELFFAAAVGSVTFVTHNKWIYAAALLQMGLADGLAAVLGVRYGKRSSYQVFGSHKSVFGSSVFLVLSILILLDYKYASGASLSVVWLVITALLATALENLAAFGLDNLVVPLAVALLLTNL